MTAEQRRQAIDFGKIRGTGMPIPTGHITAPSRAHVLNVYFEGTIIPTSVFFWRNKNRVGGVWDSRSSPSSTWRNKSSPTTSWQGRSTPQDGSTQEI